MLEIVAEIGINHDGSVDEAISLINLARDSGASTVKFQLYNVEDLLAQEVPAADYQIKGMGGQAGITQNEFLLKCQLNEAFLNTLIKHCESVGVGFLCTGYNLADFETLSRLGNCRVKLPSIAIKEPWTIIQAFSLFDHVVLSTGFSTLMDIIHLSKLLLERDIDHSRMTICHCVSQYPADLDDYNLIRLNFLRSKFPRARLGLSDHSRSNLPVNMAVALGAEFIEKHLTIDSRRLGADHHMSLNGNEFKNMSEEARKAQKIVGQSLRFGPTSEELNNLQVMGRSPYFLVARECASGTVHPKEITMRRPYKEQDNWEIFWDDVRVNRSPVAAGEEV